MSNKQSTSKSIDYGKYDFLILAFCSSLFLFDCIQPFKCKLHQIRNDINVKFAEVSKLGNSKQCIAYRISLPVYYKDFH